MCLTRVDSTGNIVVELLLKLLYPKGVPKWGLFYKHFEVSCVIRKYSLFTLDYLFCTDL